jgi:hypothetical protein
MALEVPALKSPQMEAEVTPELLPEGYRKNNRRNPQLSLRRKGGACYMHRKRGGSKPNPH